MSKYAYITIEESLSINYYKIPKQLFSDEFKNISTDAKIIYGLMLERTGLSKKNGWINDSGFVYIIYTVEELEKDLNCSNKSVTKYINELKEIGLIEVVRRGLGNPNIIYVKSLINVHFKKCKNYTSRSVKNTSLEVKKVHASNTEYSNTDISNNISPIIPFSKQDDELEFYMEKKGEKQEEIEIVDCDEKTFEKFWEIYPKKVGKKEARKSFAKILKSKNKHRTLGEIMKDLEKRKGYDEWKKNNGQFIPNPSTYLNQERWLDEYQNNHKSKQSNILDWLNDEYQKDIEEREKNGKG